MVRWLMLATATLVAVCVLGEMRVGASGKSAANGIVAGSTRASVAAGRAHSVIALPDGRVIAWGAGRRGQIGDGGTVDRWTPTQVSAVPGTMTVAAGAAHTMALTTTGEVYAWGANAHGRLGDGTEQRRLRPVRIAGLPRVVAIAAGRAHSLALTSDGRVFAWGYNAKGQLGIGGRADALTPRQITGLPVTVAIAAGSLHSLAVTSDGRVFAWGSNESSRLGDDTTTDRLRPVRIAVTDVIAVAGGGAHSLALARSGEVFAWGRNANGQLGIGGTTNASRPTLVGGLVATAIAAGRQFSAAIRTDGHVAAWGANASGQLGDHTTQRRVRPVTVAGVEAVASLALGAAHAIAVTRTGVVQAWGEGGSGRLGSGDETDATTAETIESDIPGWGGEDPTPAVAPDAPTIVPVGGIYPAAQTVTIAAARADDVIRFTIDGSDPTPTSPVYSAPLRIDSSARITARAYSAGGLASPARTADYIIDLVPPTISVTTAPPLTGGWMQTPVTVSFVCDDNVGIAVCPEPVIVSDDAVAREVSGTAVDRAGHRATARVTLNVDLRPPFLRITEPPDHSTSSAAEVVIAAVADDAASGVVGAWCNSAPVQVSAGQFRCRVTLSPGRNQVVVRAIDAAGRSTSAAVTVDRVGTPTQLLLTPATRALEVNQVAHLALRDEFGASVEGASWTSSEPAIVSLSTDEPPVLTALAIGQVMIRAEKDGLVAESSINVLPAFVPGDVRWTVPVTPGYSEWTPLVANRVAPDSPYLFAVETQASGSALVRGLDDQGRVSWTQQVQGMPLLSDAYGGIVAGEWADTSTEGAYRAFTRIGGGTTSAWRFDSSGTLDPPAQSFDGTIFALEYLPGPPTSNGMATRDKYALVLDGADGRVLSRLLLQADVDQFVSEHDGTMDDTRFPSVPCQSGRYTSPPETQGPFAGADGRGYLLVRRYTLHKRGPCEDPPHAFSDRTIEQALDLMILSRDAAARTVPVYSTSCVGTPSAPVPCDYPMYTLQLMPDGIGGTLVLWQHGIQVVGNETIIERSLTRVDEDEAVVHRAVTEEFRLQLVGQGGMALAFDERWSAMDVRTGGLQWTSALDNLGVIGARPDGGLATYDVNTLELKIIDNTGQIESTQPFSIDSPIGNLEGNWIGLKSSEVTAVVGDFADATRFAAYDQQTGQQRTREPGIGIYAKTHLAVHDLGTIPESVIRYRHVSLRVVPHDQPYWAERMADRFSGRDLFGNGFFTIGAGPGGDISLSCGGTLRAGISRESDITAPPRDPLERLPSPPSQERQVIEQLLAATSAYRNDLTYDCFPESHPGTFNSNSFVAGLLGVVELPEPRIPRALFWLFPGWATPVPAGSFQ